METTGAISGTVRVNRRYRWSNPRNRFDVDDNGLVTPKDVLTVIMWLLERRGDLPPPGPDGPPPFVDVSLDNGVTPLDALLVIERLLAGDDGEPPS